MDKLDKNKIDELLPRYCEGQVTEEERLLVEAWMNESEENRRVAKQIHSLYLATDTIHVMKKVDTEKALSRVKGRITGRKKTMWWEWAQRAAAVLFIPLLVVQLVHYWGGDEQELAQMLEVKTNPGMTTSLTLSDGTVVFLNSESRLTYPSHFNGDTRNVTLQGEAYFEVTQDSLRPFLVEFEGACVKVLGTQFNVRAYPTGPSFTTLVSGCVKIVHKNQVLQLEPGQQCEVREEKMLLHNADLMTVLAWKNGEFIFKDVALETIMDELARWYDMQVDYETEDLKKMRFYLYVERSENLEEVLQKIALTNQVKYRVNGKKIIIQR